MLVTSAFLKTWHNSQLDYTVHLLYPSFLAKSRIHWFPVTPLCTPRPPLFHPHPHFHFFFFFFPFSFSYLQTLCGGGWGWDGEVGGLINTQMHARSPAKHVLYPSFLSKSIIHRFPVTPFSTPRPLLTPPPPPRPLYFVLFIFNFFWGQFEMPSFVGQTRSK